MTETLMDNIEQKIDSGELKPAGEATVNETITAAENPAPAENPIWFWKDGVPGEGDAPEWFKKDKYKTVEAQAEAYPGLEKRLGAHKGAPEEYDLSPDKFGDTAINREDPIVSEFLTYAKDQNLSQDAVDHMLGIYSKNNSVNSTDRVAEIAKLGENGQEQLATLKQWITNNFSESEAEMIGGFCTTADSIRVMQKIRNQNIQPSIPTAQDAAAFAPKITEKMIDEMIGDDRYGADSSYTNEVRKKLDEWEKTQEGTRW